MNLKQSYSPKPGYQKLIETGKSSLTLLEMGMLHLEKGQQETLDTGEQETALIILGGHCDVKGDTWEWPGIGKRRNVFGGAAYSAFISRWQKLTVTALEKVTLAVIQSPTDRDGEPVLVKPEDVIIKTLGKPGWRRDAHFIIDERITAQHLYIGECYIHPGNWASYPPHRHEKDDMPAEGFLEEIYYYEFNMEQGFGIQKVYTDDRTIDEIYTVRTGDIVEIPRGYHPLANAPGYYCYYLWIMAGKNRGFFMRTDSDHQWINAAEVMLDKEVQ
jgi:5-deoxy-glucuronate isomerase